MTMTVMHNAGAQLSLGELNKNINKAGKALSRLSKGERLTDAGDGDSSSYAISERMREQIRSLLQDDQNVQNGSAMLRIAERGVDMIVQELRILKELAIDAANDSNTDEDRRTLQKEFDSRTATIDDIVYGSNYNGKILLDGRYNRAGVQPTKVGGGGKNTKITNMFGSFSAAFNATPASNLKNGAISRDPTTGYWINGGPWSFDADIGYEAAGSVIINPRFGVVLDFSAMQSVEPYPDTLHNQGFTILCGSCEQYINFRFDATKSAQESRYDASVNVAEDGTENSLAREYIIGVKDVKSADDLAEAIFTGVSSSRGGSSNEALITETHNNLKIERDADDPSKILITQGYGGRGILFKEGTIPNPKLGDIPDAEVETKPMNPLVIQHGTQAGQKVHIFIDDMRAEALGVTRAKVTTRENATGAISTIDNAISTALDEATNLGAWLSRMDYTNSNVTTMRDNVQNSESTIRDADMAKQMTEYTKYNILSQASQTMLSQANQNQSSILGLLQ